MVSFSWLPSKKKRGRLYQEIFAVTINKDNAPLCLEDKDKEIHGRFCDDAAHEAATR
jgi:hypothetical protein